MLVHLCCLMTCVYRWHTKRDAIESGSPVADICRQMRVTVPHLEEEVRAPGGSELRQLRLLDDENARLKRLVADFSRDKRIFSEPIRKKV